MIREKKKRIDLVGGADMVINLTNGEGMTRIPILDDERTGAKIFWINKAGDRTHYGCAARLNIDDKLVRTYNSDGTASSVYVNEYGETFTSTKQYYVVDENDQIVVTPYSETRYNDDGELVGIDNRRAYEQEFLPNGNEIITDNRHLPGSLIESDLGEELTKIREKLNSYMQQVSKHVRVTRTTYHIMSDLQTYALDHNSNEIEALINSEIDTHALLTMDDYAEMNFYRSSECHLVDVQKEAMCNYIIARDTKNREKALEHLRCFTTTLTEYNAKLRAYPRMFMKTEDAIKGYNENGELVAVRYNDGRGFKVFRNSTGEITHLEGLDGSIITFKYNPMKALCCVTDTAGNKTELEYEFLSGHVNETLSRVKYNDSRILDITFDSPEYQIVGISSPTYRKKVVLDMVCTDSDTTDYFYTVNKITYLGAPSNADADDNTAYTETDFISISYRSLSNVTVSLDTFQMAREATLLKKNGDSVILLWDKNSMFIYEFIIINGNVSDAKGYYYDSLRRTHTTQLDMSYANLTNYYFFNYAVGEHQTSELNEFNEPSVTTGGGKKFGAESEQSFVTTYHYNLDRQLLKTVTVVSITGTDKTYTVTERFFYDTLGRLARKESFVEGEELTSGIFVEETVYSDDGLHAKSFTYNTLDSSSKTYTEKELDESGRVISEMDSTGRATRRFEYDSAGNVICEILPNGSRYAYGRDSFGRITSITHSSDIGEENSTQKIYDGVFLKELRSGNNVVKYTYDERGRIKSVDLNDSEDYITYTYTGDDTDEQTTVATLGDTTFTIVKDKHGNIISNRADSSENAAPISKTVNNEYDNRNRLIQTTLNNSTSEEFTYDDADHITKFTVGGVEKESYNYDAEGNLTSKVIDGRSYAYSYTDTMDKKIKSISTSGAVVEPTFDCNGRNTGKRIKVNGALVSEEQISYLKFGDRATMMPSAIMFSNNQNGVFAMRDTLKYKYDVMGNITAVYENGMIYSSYEYDSLGRLKRENNTISFDTIIYSYDDNGNIIAKYRYDYTTDPTNELITSQANLVIKYCYDNDSDRLLSYGDSLFEYDEIGNPTLYKGKTLKWKFGRELAMFDSNTFTYDARGRRISKNNIKFEYDHTGRLIKQYKTGSNTNEITDSLEFMYDHTGVFAFKYNGTTYFYRKNVLNDIIAILDNAGNVVVKYTYSALGWCNVTFVADGAKEISTLNPFRFRSYYYDTETSLYFLKTRYYDPAVGRFINMDDTSYLAPDLINGLNLYAYCGNNPVMRVDPNGNFAIGALIAGAVIGSAINFVSSVAGQYVAAGEDWKKVNWGMAAHDGFWGAINGVLATTGMGAITSAILGAGTGFASSVTSDLIFGENHEVQWDNAFINGAIGLAAGVISGAGANSSGDVTKYINGKDILNRTIANGKVKAIANQAASLAKHTKELIESGVKYVISNFLATFFSKGVS